MIEVDGYLTQQKLIDIVRNIPEFMNILLESRVGDTRCRWDILVDYNGKKIAIEFDGDRHYWDSTTIRLDNIKNKIAEESGIKVIRIPYFIQLTKETFKYYFGFSIDIEQDFPHGFITTKIFPASYSRLGYLRYTNELKNLPENIVKDIDNSLKKQSEKYGSEYVYWSI